MLLANAGGDSLADDFEKELQVTTAALATLAALA
jgi:hypothetical protein